MRALPNFDPTHRHARQQRSMIPGTLNGTVLSARPRPPKPSFNFEEPAPATISPWAWYRSDDLTFAEGEIVNVWPDRIGSRDLVLAGASGGNPIMGAAAIDGQREVIASSLSAKSLQADYAAHSMADGVSVLMVGRDELGYSNNPIVGMAFAGGAEMYWQGSAGFFFAEFNVGSLGGIGATDPGVTQGYHAFLGVVGPDVARLWRDGTELIHDPAGAFDYHATAGAATWAGAVSEWLLLEFAGAATGVAEYAIWDHALTSGEAADACEYALARYPSLT